MTGFYRTGKFLASDYCEEKPDIICLSKGITGGFLPLGVTACTLKIFDTFYDNEVDKTFFHGHSYTGNPLACAAAVASFEILMSDDCQESIQRIMQSHADFVGKIKLHNKIVSVRHTGTILAIELKTQEDSGYFNTIKNKVYYYALENGVLLRPLGNVIYILPPYCITESELFKIYDVISNLLEEVI
jgi:adenosylmethionine-8-amino-7-oxononanoate aminotransferase